MSITVVLLIELCTASVFAQPNDALAGGVAPYLGRRVRPTDLGVAHRTLPLGSKVLIINVRTQRSVIVKVIDRGPFGRTDKRGRWYNGAKLYRKHRREGRPLPTTGWRGCVDLTPRVARKLGHNGFEPVLVLPQVSDNTQH